MRPHQRKCDPFWQYISTGKISNDSHNSKWSYDGNSGHRPFQVGTKTRFFNTPPEEVHRFPHSNWRWKQIQPLKHYEILASDDGQCPKFCSRLFRQCCSLSLSHSQYRMAEITNSKVQLWLQIQSKVRYWAWRCHLWNVLQNAQNN